MKLLADIYPGMAQTRHRNIEMLPHYLKWGEHTNWLTKCVMPSIKEFWLRHNYKVPQIFRRVHEDMQRRSRLLADDMHTTEVQYAREAMGRSNDDMLAERSTIRFGSWFVMWFGDMALNWFQLTRTQGAVAQFALGAMARPTSCRVFR
jgi:hypothetical protein